MTEQKQHSLKLPDDAYQVLRRIAAAEDRPMSAQAGRLIIMAATEHYPEAVNGGHCDES